MQLTKYEIKGSTLQEKLVNGAELKKLLTFEEYPLNFCKSLILNESIVSYDGKLYVHDKGTLTDYPFMQTHEFMRALELVDRPKVGRLRMKPTIVRPINTLGA